MPAIPLIGMGISAYSAYRQQKSQGQNANAQRDLMRQQSGLANEMGRFAKQQHSMAEPALNKAMQHYMTLATGSRGAIGAEIAPEVNSITEASRGAERGMDRSMAAGPQRDRAIAELYRQRAGQIGMLPFAARQNAFQSMEQAGNNRMAAAMEGYRGAGAALTGAGNTGVQANAIGNQRWNSINEAIQYGQQGAQGAYDWYSGSRTPKQSMFGLPLLKGPF